MIKKVIIRYPEFKVDVTEDFKDGVNVLERDNGYGKSVILNTLLSMYTAKYPGIGKKQYPEGTAQVLYTEDSKDKQAMLVRGAWVGTPSTNPLYRWIQVGEFFRSTKSTDEQRNLLVQLLGLNYDTYMAERIKDFYPDQLKELEQELKIANSNEGLILQDITRLEGLLFPIEEKTFPAIQTYEDTIKLLQSKKTVFNDSVFKNNSEKNKLTLEITNLTNKINNKERDIKLLREDYVSKEEAKCKTCGQSIPKDEIKLAFIASEGKQMSIELEKLKADLVGMQKKVESFMESEPITESDPVKLAQLFKIELDVPPLEMYAVKDLYLQAIRDQEVYRKELELKKEQLKKLNHLDLQDKIELVKETKQAFLSLLEEKVKATGLNVELFKVSKEGNISNTFKIMNKDGTEYADLSTGNKLLLEVEVAMLFVKTLGLDLILIDEAAVIGKNILNDVLDKCSGVQIIMSKPTAWKLKT